MSSQQDYDKFAEDLQFKEVRIDIPENTCFLYVVAKVYDEDTDSLVDVESKYDAKEVRKKLERSAIDAWSSRLP